MNGELTEEAFIQCIMTATEAKGKVMNDQKVIDQVTGTIATGTSTDSILIAATQKGTCLEFAGTITPLGKLISKAVYECTTKAVQKSRQRIPNMMIYHLLSITVAYFIDMIVGDPPNWPHPVKWIGADDFLFRKAVEQREQTNV